MHNLLERVAQELWSRFAPEHHIEWEDEQGKAEYRLAAEAVLDLASHTPAPQPGGAVKVTVGYSLANEWWWVRIYPCTSEQDARRLGRRILSALEPSPSAWNVGAEAEEVVATYLAGLFGEAVAARHRQWADELIGRIRALPLPTPPAGEG